MLFTSAQHCCVQAVSLMRCWGTLQGSSLSCFVGEAPSILPGCSFPFFVTSCSALWTIYALCCAARVTGGFWSISSVGSDPECCHGHPFHPTFTSHCREMHRCLGAAAPAVLLCISITQSKERETVRETANSPIPSSFPGRLGTAGGSRAQPPCLEPQNCWALL